MHKTYVDYNTIAERFSRARQDVWPEFDFLFKNAKGKVLDLGCGNGRFYEKLKHTDYTGLDISDKLIGIAQKKYGKEKFKVGSALDMPFLEKEFDLIYSFALLHHISPENHNRFKEEVKRVLKEGGVFILTVWNLSKKRGKEILIPWFGLKEQYFYSFTLEELELLFKDFKVIQKGEIKIKKNSNYYLILKKE
jgi:SAM-dependent methyltransferase